MKSVSKLSCSLLLSKNFHCWIKKENKSEGNDKFSIEKIKFLFGNKKSPIFFDFFINCVYNWSVIYFISFVENMKNKGLLIKFCFTVFAFLLCGLSFTSATTTFHLTGIQWLQGLQDNVRQKIMYIHFANNWNDFWWLFYLANLSWAAYSSSSTGNVEIRTNGTGYSCSIQLRWFYYNAERWERLWPLDEETMIKWQVQDRLGMSWWIYMACEPTWRSAALEECKNGSNLKQHYEACVDDVNKEYPGDGNGFYWEIEQTYSWDNFHLVVWVDYTGYTVSNKFITMESGSDLSPTFIRLGNQFPVGFVYDYNWWIWLAWCRIEGGKDVRELVNLFYSPGKSLSTLFRADNNSGLVYQGGNSLNIQCSGISLANTLSRIVIEWVVWMTDGDDEKQAQLGTYWNMSDTKMQYFATKTVTNSAMMNYVRKKAELLCRWKWKNNCSSSCSTTTEKIKCCNNMGNVSMSLGEGCTYIIKDGDATIQADKWGYDVYLLSGNLYIDETTITPVKKVFDENWFVKNDQVNVFSGVAGSGGYTWTEGAAVWVLITWNFVVNGGVKAYTGYSATTGTLENKYFIYGKFTTKDTFQSLEDVFAWRCLNGIGTDGNWCPDLQRKNPYSEASLVIIDQNYDSPLRQ